MKKKKTTRTSWNSGLAIGQKNAFSINQLAQIETHLRTVGNWHDLALLALGIDSMLRGGDLLNLQVWQVIHPNGTIRSTIATKQMKTQRSVFPALTRQTRDYLAYWLRISRKTPADYIFTRTKPATGRPITRSHYADIVKSWAEMLSLEPGDYSTHSIRRTKPVYMYGKGEEIALISKLLGHKSVAVTIEYLGITQAKAKAASLRHPMLRGFKFPSK